MIWSIFSGGGTDVSQETCTAQPGGSAVHSGVLSPLGKSCDVVANVVKESIVASRDRRCLNVFATGWV